MGNFDLWKPIISAGVQLATGLLDDEDKEDERDANKEIAILGFKDDERDRLSAERISAASNAAALEAAQIKADAALDQIKKRVLGDVLLQRGQGQEKAMLESFRSAANKPERFGSAASILAQVLSR